MKKPVILQVLPSVNVGGVERGTLEIAKALIDNGFEALVASSGGKMEYNFASIKAKHIKIPLASKNPFTIFSNIERLVKIIKDYNVDIVHARSRAPAWSAYFAAKITGCHFITTFHGTYSFKSKVKKTYNSVMVKGERIIAISDFIKNHIIENYGVNENIITVIPRGVDVNQFCTKNVSNERIIQLSNKLNIEHDRILILLPGRITSWKGHDILLDALVSLPKDKYRCIFVGEMEKHPNYINKIEKKIVDLELTDNVKIFGSVKDMPALYSLSDIVVAPSTRPEAFGRVAIEAQSMERIIIATDHGGSKETVINGKTGFLVPPNDATALAGVLNEALEISNKKRKTITNRARKHIQENFTLDNMVSKTISLYKKIIGIK